MWSSVGGAALLGAAVVGFFLSVIGRANTLAMHSMTTLPTLVAVGLLGYAWRLYRSPKSVTVSSGGITIERGSGKQTYSWDTIGWSTVDEAAITMQRQLVIYDVRARALAKLAESIGDFNTLVELVESHVDARPDSTKDFVRLRRAKRTGLGLAAGGTLLILAGCGVAWDMHDRQRQERLLAESGIPGSAEIVSRHLAPNGVTPRLEYRITTPRGLSATRNAEVTRELWDGLEQAAIVPVLYVPDEPEISVLLFGEVKNDDPANHPVVAYGMTAAASGFGLILIVVGIISFCGWDIGRDSKTNRFAITRIGDKR